MKLALLTVSRYVSIITILTVHQGLTMDMPSTIQDGNDSDTHIAMTTLPSTVPQNITQIAENTDIIDGVDITEDIPGCCDNCLRITLKGLRICQVPIDLTTGVAALASAVLIGFSHISASAEAFFSNITSPNGTLTTFFHDINQSQNLNLAVICLNGITAVLIFTKLGVQHAILYDQQFLKQLVEDYHKKNK